MLCTLVSGISDISSGSLTPEVAVSVPLQALDCPALYWQVVACSADGDGVKDCLTRQNQRLWFAALVQYVVLRETSLDDASCYGHCTKI
jgi:hypothetical protein